MNLGLLKTLAMAAAGLIYDLFLAGIGVIGAGAGHGTYVLIGLYASPVSLMENIGLALLGIPVLWCITGVLAAGTRKRGWTIAFLVAMFAHYVSLPLVLRDGNTFGDWEYAAKDWGYVQLGIGFYLFGQAVIWIVFLVELFMARTPTEQS